MTQDTIEPKTVAEAATSVRECAKERLSLAFEGGGTHAIGRHERAGVVLSTRALRRIVEYVPEDQTVTVEAGVTFTELSGVLAARGQRLAVDVAEPDRSTVGGAIAANAFGPRRMRFGSFKDLILGVGLVRADGVRARAGGKVVKNVAGFDLSKLMVGSHGTLALVTSATLRLHPLPQATRVLRLSALSPDEAWDLVLAMRQRHLEPVAVTALGSAGGASRYDVDVSFEGFPAGVDAQTAGVLEIARERGWAADVVDPAIARDGDARARTAGPFRARGTVLPSHLSVLDALAVAPLAASLDEPAVCAYPALGMFFVAGKPKTPQLAFDAVAGARAHLERDGGTLVVEAVPGDCAGIEPWGTPPPSLRLMREIKARFDPDGRIGGGDFVGGL
jgi:glycolate oxidase FAD binding subunit